MASFYQLLGPPPLYIRQRCYEWVASLQTFFFQKDPQYIRMLEISRMLSQCPDKQFLSFLEGCLQWDPQCRITPQQAFRHPWICKFTQLSM